MKNFLETRTETGRSSFYHLKPNDTHQKTLKYAPGEKNSQLPVAVRFSKTSMLKLSFINTRWTNFCYQWISLRQFIVLHDYSFDDLKLEDLESTASLY